MVSTDPNSRGGKRRYLDSTVPEEYIPDVGEVDLSELSLTGLANLFGSDKGGIKHNYCKIYSRILEEALNRVSPNDLVIGEVGVACGASLRMWAHHLPKSQIVGFDIRSECQALCGDMPNVEIVIGDATKASTFEGRRFDIFVDDGSHVAEHIVQTFNQVWGNIKPGGFYVVEDIACTYNPNYSESLLKNLGLKTENRRSTFVAFVDALMRATDARQLQLGSLSYYPQMLVLRKEG